MSATKQIVIIGAGPGGLASAMLLAAAGFRVRVLERRDRVGGRTSAIDGQGYRFDLGPTFFLYPRVLEAIYRAVGRDLRSEVELVRLDPQYHLIFGGGGELKATGDVARMQGEIARLSSRDAAQFPRFLCENRLKMDRFRPVLESPFLGWMDLLSPHLARLLPILRPFHSLDGELRRFFEDARVRLAMTFQSKYLGMSPFQCPSLFSILSFIEYEYGVFHPIGGCSAITESMAGIARELGVVISLDDEVQSIRFRGRRAIGVQSTSGFHACDALVINADFARAMNRLVPDSLRRRWSDRRIAGKRFSCSTFMLYFGVEGRLDDLSHHTIYLAADYLRNLEDIERRHVLSDDPSFYVQNACVTDPALAPRGCSTLYVLVPVTHQHPNVDWAREGPRFRRVALRQLARLGIVDVESRIRFERMITPADWDHGHQIHLGSTFNLAHTLRQMLHLRPGNRFEGLESVYLVGGGTHPGSGLPVIFESARITSRLIGRDHGIPVPWDGPEFEVRRPARIEEVPEPEPARLIEVA